MRVFWGGPNLVVLLAKTATTSPFRRFPSINFTSSHLVQLGARLALLGLFHEDHEEEGAQHLGFGRRGWRLWSCPKVLVRL